MCHQCGDEIFEEDYVYIIDRYDVIHICVYCYNDYIPFYCENCGERRSYFQLCSHGVACNNNGCCICEFCQEEK